MRHRRKCENDILDWETV